jgi:hypothetical protein
LELDGDEWSGSSPGRFTPEERAPGKNWIGGWMGLRAGLDAVVKRKIPNPRRESNPYNPIVQCGSGGSVQALSEAVRESVRPCDVQKLTNSLNIKNSCGIDGIPNEYLKHLTRRPLFHLTGLFNHFLRLLHFFIVLEGSKSDNLTKTR